MTEPKEQPMKYHERLSQREWWEQNVATPQQKERHSGRTARLALTYALILVEHPASPLLISDHHPTSRADDDLSGKVVELLRMLGIQCEESFTSDGHVVSVKPINRRVEPYYVNPLFNI